MSDVFPNEADVTEAAIAAGMGEAFDEARGARAWAAVEAEASALADDAVERSFVNLVSAAFQAMRVHAAAKAPAAAARLSLLPGEVYDASHADRLKAYAWAALFVRRKASSEATRTTRAQVPSELVAFAQALRRNMLKVVDYHLGEDPVIAAEIAAIRAGSGHVDLATDLEELADLYEDQATRLAGDGSHYRASDASEARRLSNQIYTHLGQTPEARKWLDARHRIFTLLKRSHAEVVAAARFLFRNEPARLAEFPSLYAPTGTKAKKKPAPAPQAPAVPETEGV